MIAPVLQHAVDLMNDRRQLVAASHSLLHAEQPSKSDVLLASHRTDNFQVSLYDYMIVSFRTLTLPLGLLEGHPACKILVPIVLKVICKGIIAGIVMFLRPSFLSPDW